MKVAIAYEVLLMNIIILKIYNKYSVKQFTKWRTWFYSVFKAIGNKKDQTLLTKNTEEKQNSVTVIPLDGKGTVFPVKLKLEGKSFE